MKDVLAYAGVILGFLVWVALILASMALPVVGLIWLLRNM
jgi:hypothetical protein